jgi:hypothetical protein
VPCDPPSIYGRYHQVVAKWANFSEAAARSREVAAFRREAQAGSGSGSAHGGRYAGSRSGSMPRSASSGSLSSPVASPERRAAEGSPPAPSVPPLSLLMITAQDHEEEDDAPGRDEW